MRCVLACALASVTACYGGGSFVCEANDQCSAVGVLGVCQPDTHFCSFNDPACSSGQRYGNSAGASSGQCVGGTTVDGGIDVPGEPGIDAQECFGTPLQVCRHPPPTMPLTLPGTINTDTDCQFPVTQAGGPDLCGIAATTLTIHATRVSGMKGLVLVATDSIVIDGALDESSKRGNGNGPGADSPDCTTAGPGGQDDGGGSGGAGGSFIGKGADGGLGDHNNNGPPNGSRPGGPAGNTQTTTIVRGGCPGAIGGDGIGGNKGGVGGHGGGAVYLIAGNAISILAGGGVFASGSGGDPGQAESGGGGGGSGGTVGFDAPTITVDGAGEVAANGAAGGGGGGTNSGQPGEDGTTTQWDQKANGGQGGAGGVPDAGDGTATTTINAPTPTDSDGGGGGAGGGIGLVWVHGNLSGTRVSPSPTTR